VSHSIYFSPADRQLQPFLSKDAFERSLYMSLLLYGKLAVPDIFFFISGGLSAHLRNSSGDRRTLFEVALADRLVVPWFRNPRSTTFHDALRDVRPPDDEKARIQGILPEADQIADRLQAAVDTAHAFEPRTWPPAIGERYKANIVSKLIEGHPLDDPAFAPEMRRDLHQYWIESEGWRVDCVNQACEFTAQAGHKGLQRGQLMNAVGHDVGIPKSETVHDVRQILACVSSETKRGLALRYFCRAFNEIYHETQASAFDADLAIPNLGLSGLQLIGSDLATGAGGREECALFVEQVRMPTIESLRKVPPKELLAVSNDTGIRWRAAVLGWQMRQDNTDELRRCLKRYSAALQAIARQHSADDYPWLQVVVGAGTPWGKVVWGALGVASAVASVVSPLPGIGIAVLASGFAIYAFTAARTEKVVVSLPPRLITDTHGVDLTTSPHPGHWDEKKRLTGA
jgi:hypothetical protein